MCARKNSSRGATTGFTLIELLVAISILAVVAVLGWRGLDSIVRSRMALTADMEQTRGMQLAFAQLQSDCAHVADLASMPNREPVVVTPERLILVRSVFADDQPTRLQVIVYRLKDGALSRRESVATRDLSELDALWQSAMNDLDASPAVILQTKVASMTLRTWLRNAGGWGGAATAVVTVATAAGAPAPNVLAGLEVTLQLREHAGSMRKVFLLGPV